MEESADFAVGLMAAVPAGVESALRTVSTLDKSADLLAEKRTAVAMLRPLSGQTARTT